VYKLIQAGNESIGESGMTYRVLSLDGGGIWALIQVQALIALFGENTSGHEVLQNFDLAAGTSGGSIVLGGLVEGVNLGELQNYFGDEKNRRSIFSRTLKPVGELMIGATGMGPKYSAEAKLPALERLMPKTGTALLPDAAFGIRRQGCEKDVHLLITAFDYDRNCARFFRSAPATAAQWGEGTASNVTLAEAIHASSNAPVLFFDEPATFGGGRYWDGAISGCNNPILAAVAEAIVLRNCPKTIAALSIGTHTNALFGPPVDNPSSPYIQAKSTQNITNDLGKLASSVTSDPPDIATYLAHVMTGGGSNAPSPAHSRIVRMNPYIAPVKDPAGNMGPPNYMSPAEFKYFLKLPMDAIEQNQVEYILRCAQYWLTGEVRNEPIRADGDTLALELGYETFGDAVAAWNAIKDA
jgi:hypothetical protein